MSPDLIPTIKPRRQRRWGFFIGGLASGVVVGVVAALMVSFLTVKAAHDAKTMPPGNVTITMQDNLMTAGMRVALSRVQNKLPFTITGVSAVTKPGDDVELTATGQPLLGAITPSLTIAMSPQITNGQLDFHILSINGLGLGPFDSLIEQAMNDEFAGVAQGQLVKGLDYQLVDVRTVAGALIITAKVYSPA